MATVRSTDVRYTLENLTPLELGLLSELIDSTEPLRAPNNVVAEAVLSLQEALANVADMPEFGYLNRPAWIVDVVFSDEDEDDGLY